MWSTLSCGPRPGDSKKCLLAVTPFSNAFMSAIGQLTTFVEPGSHGTQCDVSMIDQLYKTVEDQNPSLIYIHVPFVNDNENSKGYCSLISFAEELTKAGRTCIVADTRHTDRWSGVEPTLCMG